MLRGNVLITGGAGFLGRGIIRRALHENWPCGFTIYSRDEQKQDVCKHQFDGADIDYVLGDVRDTDRLSLAMRRHSTVIHAAALKYVPEAEFNVHECVGVNVYGTQSVIAAARHARVQNVVLISTDKAVEPLNTYGMTKALAERLFVEAAIQDGTLPAPTWHICRYGNVIGSTGSVVPLFKRQQATLGRITITDPSMTRFWISVHEAVDLILASLDAESGVLVVPQPRSLSIGALARAVCGDDVAIDEIGVRPGERMHERLLTGSEGARVALLDGYYWHYARHFEAREPIIELDSFTADRMSSDEFVRLVEDAATV